MTYAPSQLLTFEAFLAQYRDEPAFELADGELIDMEPTGPHEAVAGKVASRLNLAIDRMSTDWLIPRTCILRPFSDQATARRPDVTVLDESALRDEPLWEREPVITQSTSVKLVVEVVSTNWETDYARKVEEYALMGIPEYWIVDFRGLGGVAFIGRPKQPTFTVCQLVNEDYVKSTFRLGQEIVSPAFPDLALKLNDVMPL
ncbi:Uma2 family endonuclease [Leptolyngbya iicbica]|uniref:Uma2 family endonuclease n=2 Tax=Cyanophyceae TaxID=3028117 RepID=A0A4Q7E4Z6_9CYAN|nr:Uma2 family endonuclease [Leptolyngbya sp. LK]RZM77940.1 Uma2 family endonuclease [Leptolyngbya sp. LK]